MRARGSQKGEKRTYKSRLMTNTPSLAAISSMNRSSPSFESSSVFQRCQSDLTIILRRKQLACFNLHARMRTHARARTHARVMPGITPVYSFTPIPHGALPTYTRAHTRARDHVARVYVYESAFMSRASPCRVLLRNRTTVSLKRWTTSPPPPAIIQRALLPCARQQRDR